MMVVMMMVLADIRDIDVRDTGSITSLLCIIMIIITRVLLGSMILLVFKACVGAVRSLEMVILGIRRPGMTSVDK